jgi:hypothetical protein
LELPCALLTRYNFAKANASRFFIVLELA